MKIPKLAEQGFCHSCQTWIDLVAKSCLPAHNDKRGEECPSSFHRPVTNKYLVRTSEDARILAEFIEDDVGGCLYKNGGVIDRVYQRHSIRCDDGADCAAERLQLAQALATFLLENRPERMDAARLYKSGRDLARLAQSRPDAVHRKLLGFKHELERDGFYPQLGELLYALWRHAWFTLDPTTLPIPFLPLNEVPSGSGHLKP